MVPPESVRLPAPAAAVAVPPHVLVSDGVAATRRLAGKVSVKARPLRAPPVWLITVTVSVEVPLTAMVAGANAPVTPIPPTESVAALEVAPAVGVWKEVTPLLVVVYVPATALRTST